METDRDNVVRSRVYIVGSPGTSRATEDIFRRLDGLGEDASVPPSTTWSVPEITAEKRAGSNSIL